MSTSPDFVPQTAADLTWHELTLALHTFSSMPNPAALVAKFRAACTGGDMHANFDPRQHGSPRFVDALVAPRSDPIGNMALKLAAAAAGASNFFAVNSPSTTILENSQHHQHHEQPENIFAPLAEFGVPIQEMEERVEALLDQHHNGAEGDPSMPSRLSADAIKALALCTLPLPEQQEDEQEEEQHVELPSAQDEHEQQQDEEQQEQPEQAHKEKHQGNTPSSSCRRTLLSFLNERALHHRSAALLQPLMTTLDAALFQVAEYQHARASTASTFRPYSSLSREAKTYRGMLLDRAKIHEYVEGGLARLPSALTSLVTDADDVCVWQWRNLAEQNRYSVVGSGNGAGAALCLPMTSASHAGGGGGVDGDDSSYGSPAQSWTAAGGGAAAVPRLSSVASADFENKIPVMFCVKLNYFAELPPGSVSQSPVVVKQQQQQQLAQDAEQQTIRELIPMLGSTFVVEEVEERLYEENEASAAARQHHSSAYRAPVGGVRGAFLHVTLRQLPSPPTYSALSTPHQHQFVMEMQHQLRSSLRSVMSDEQDVRGSFCELVGKHHYDAESLALVGTLAATPMKAALFNAMIGGHEILSACDAHVAVIARHHVGGGDGIDSADENSAAVSAASTMNAAARSDDSFGDDDFAHDDQSANQNQQRNQHQHQHQQAGHDIRLTRADNPRLASLGLASDVRGVREIAGMVDLVQRQTRRDPKELFSFEVDDETGQTQTLMRHVVIRAHLPVELVSAGITEVVVLPASDLVSHYRHIHQDEDEDENNNNNSNNENSGNTEASIEMEEQTEQVQNQVQDIEPTAAATSMAEEQQQQEEECDNAAALRDIFTIASSSEPPVTKAVFKSAIVSKMYQTVLHDFLQNQCRVIVHCLGSSGNADENENSNENYNENKSDAETELSHFVIKSRNPDVPTATVITTCFASHHQHNHNQHENHQHQKQLYDARNLLHTDFLCEEAEPIHREIFAEIGDAARRAAFSMLQHELAVAWRRFVWPRLRSLAMSPDERMAALHTLNAANQLLSTSLSQDLYHVLKDPEPASGVMDVVKGAAWSLLSAGASVATAMVRLPFSFFAAAIDPNRWWSEEFFPQRDRGRDYAARLNADLLAAEAAHFAAFGGGAMAADAATTTDGGYNNHNEEDQQHQQQQATGEAVAGGGAAAFSTTATTNSSNNNNNNSKAHFSIIPYALSTDLSSEFLIDYSVNKKKAASGQTSDNDPLQQSSAQQQQQAATAPVAQPVTAGVSRVVDRTLAGAILDLRTRTRQVLKATMEVVGRSGAAEADQDAAAAAERKRRIETLMMEHDADDENGQRDTFGVFDEAMALLQIVCAARQFLEVGMVVFSCGAGGGRQGGRNVSMENDVL